jgi:hypothetical protein
MRKKYSLHVTRKKGDRRNSISRKVTKTLLSCPVLPLTTLWQGYRGFLPSFLPSRSSPWCTVKWFSSIWNLEHKGHLSFWLFNTLLSACCLPLQFLLLCVPFHVICRFLSIPRNFFFLPRTNLYIYIFYYFFLFFFIWWNRNQTDMST